MGDFSLYKPFKSKDYEFIDKIVKQNIHIGGTGILVHKYLGPKFQGDTQDATQPNPSQLSELSVQDLLLIENRDRNYDKNLIDIKGVYNINELEFNLSQFGLMLAGETIFITFHLNDMIEKLGRKIIPGDVLELVHRRDDLLLDQEMPPLNAFYVVEDASRSAEGYSQTWLPHVWRTKCVPIKDSQEYKDILDREEQDRQLRDVLSTQEKTTQISDLVDEQAQTDVPSDNFDSSHYFIQSGSSLPGDNMLPWVFNGDGIPPNGNETVPSGTRFPQSPQEGEYFLRTDYKPERLFRREDNRWIAIEDNWSRQYQPARSTLEDFMQDDQVEEFGPRPDQKQLKRQSVSKAVKNKSQIPPKDEDLGDDQEDN